MGIKDLWTILSPFCERKPLYELQNKRVAVDLSCWVCESQNIAEYNVQPRMYLRNLYFRTCFLLLMDVRVVFVLEGRAPELKYKTIAARNAIQFKGAKPKTSGTKTGKDRSRFNHTLRQCEEMLRLMGIACVKGEGEAEALCAYLNEDGLVDGIISQDSDCFAYGACVVYRNFSISQKGGSVDVYDIAKANAGLNFGRNKIIALALLCGSDYCEGVHGIGKDSALKLFSTVSDDDILNRLRSWKDNSKYEQLEAKISDKNLCTSCGHFGKLQSHSRKGCLHCGTSQGCSGGKFKNERLEIKNELNVRSKALVDSEFPDETLISEFLTRKGNVSVLNLEWRRPDLVGFVKFTVKYLTWEEIYAFEKFFPILTRWQLINSDQIDDQTPGVVHPKCIKKKRSPKGVASYEVVWEDTNGDFTDLIPSEQLEQFGDQEKLWSTIEPQSLVEKAHPSLVERFESSRKPKKGRKKPNPITEIEDLLQNVSITAPGEKKKGRKKRNPIKEVDELLHNVSITGPSDKKRVKKTNTLDAFVIQAASTPKRANVEDCTFDWDRSNFGDEDDLDVSDIVDAIIERKPPRLLDMDACSFFVNDLVENDLFEKTFNQYCDSSVECESD